MKRQYPMTLKQVQMLKNGELELKEFQGNNPPHMVLCGFIIKYISNAEFTLFDGTAEMDIKLENPIHDVQNIVKEGSLVKVICFSTKTDRCRPMIGCLCNHGEQLFVHYARCINVSKDSVKDEDDYDMQYFATGARFG